MWKRWRGGVLNKGGVNGYGFVWNGRVEEGRRVLEMGEMDGEKLDNGQSKGKNESRGLELRPRIENGGR